MKINKLFFTIIFMFLAICMLPASAVYTRPSVIACGGVSFCFPTADYLKQYPGNADESMPVARTSLSYSVDVEPFNLGFRVGNNMSFDVGAGFCFTGFSKSLPYGKSIIRAYNGFGTCATLAFRYERFSAELKYRYIKCSFSGTQQNFICMDYVITPGYMLCDSVGLKAPVTVSRKADSVTLSLGLGFGISCPSGGGSLK